MPTTRTNVRKLQREMNLDPQTVAVKSAPDPLGRRRGGRLPHASRHHGQRGRLRPRPRSPLALNVSEVLADNAVVLGLLDRVEPPMETPVTDGLVVSVVRGHH